MRAMKDSGIPWIGMIPEGWKQIRLKNECKLHGRIGWNGLRSDEFEEESYAYLVTGQDFIGSSINWNNCYQIRQERYEEDPFIQLYEGELLVTKDGTIGKIAVVDKLDKPACLNSGIFVLRQKGNAFVPKFLYWQLISPLLKTFNNYINSGGSTIIHLYQNVFERMPLVLPPLSEQERIADFLDSKCGEIDEMIALQEKTVEELKAYKQSVITEAVTKGLNPDAPMKDSGIPWIGLIPQGWSVKRFKNILRSKLQYGANESGLVFNPTLPRYVRITDILDNRLREDIDKQSLTNEQAKDYILEDKDILFARSGGTVGKSFIYKKEYGLCAYAGYLIRAKVDENNYSEFVYYYTLSPSYDNWKNSIFIQSTIQNIGGDKYSLMEIPCPPLTEQQAIASYLDKKCSEIDSLIEIKQQKAAELKTYKKSLIYEYVTGKKEVV